VGRREQAADKFVVFGNRRHDEARPEQVRDVVLLDFDDAREGEHELLARERVLRRLAVDDGGQQVRTPTPLDQPPALAIRGRHVARARLAERALD
jgi:hypothetical protein